MHDTAPTSTFGHQPRTPRDVDAALTPAGRVRLARALEATHRQVQRDAAVAFATGRWNPGRPDPDRYVAGDAVALRAFTVAGDLHRLFGYHAVTLNPNVDTAERREAAARVLTLHADMNALYDAVPHFLDGPTADGIVHSRPPDAEVLDAIRLPYPSVAVFFGATLTIPEGLHDWPAEWELLTDLAGHPTDVRTSLGDLTALGGGIEGVVLREAPGGGLADEALWILSVNPDPNRGELYGKDRYRALEWGRLSTARLAHVATNVAAAVAWGEWREPTRRLGLPDNPAGREWRRAVRRGEFRRHEPAGAVGGVRVLDLCRSPVTRDRSRSLAEIRRRSPTPHLRRAHWRLQPHGPGGTARKLIRVAAVVVNAGAGAPAATSVYTVPTPEPGDATFTPRPEAATPTAAPPPGIGRTPTPAPALRAVRSSGFGR